MQVAAVTSAAARAWMAADPNEATRGQVQTLLDGNNASKLVELFESPRIAFGTAGLRAETAPGPSRMNELVVAQAAFGFANWALKNYGEEVVAVIGFDHRERNGSSSKKMAAATAAAFSKAGIKHVKGFTKFVVPTPLVPFAMIKLNAQIGAMVTASHNPAFDSGFKAYVCGGVQISSPIDDEISKEISTFINSSDSAVLTRGLSLDGFPESCEDLSVLSREYPASVASQLTETNRTENANLRYVYTACHGVGRDFFSAALDACGLPQPIVVEIQSEKPDSNFSTLVDCGPNPENPKTLRLAIERADEEGVGIVIAHDPDADRLALAEKLSSSDLHSSSDHSKNWKIFTGDEIATVLAYSLFEKLKSSGEKLGFVASAVSSKFLERMCEAEENLEYRETHTGFKNLGKAAMELREKGVRVVLAYEEALGFMIGGAPDKDGISTGCQLIEILSTGASPSRILREAYERYTRVTTYNGSISLNDDVVAAHVFDSVRSHATDASLHGKWKVAGVRDLKRNSNSGVGGPLLSPTSGEMLTIQLEHTTEKSIILATLRKSGTEPKLKYYTQLVGDSTAASFGEFCEEILQKVWLNPPLRKALKKFEMTTTVKSSLVNAVYEDLLIGLKDNSKSQMLMLPSFVQKLPTGRESGTFYALDLGGTNFRVSKFVLDGKGNSSIEAEVKQKIPDSAMTGTKLELFDFLASAVKSVISLEKNPKLGFTFSFPLKQLALSKGELIQWTKGFTTSGIVGEEVVGMLEDSLGMPGCVKALINDTVGTLAAGAAQTGGKCKIGVILGTGTNAAYVERLSEVKTCEANFENGSDMVINAEWGAFSNFPRNSYDETVDGESPNVGRQFFEKAVSGFYLGEIVRLVCVDLWKEGAFWKGGGGEFPLSRGEFESWVASEAESTSVNDFLSRLISLGFTNATEDDARTVRVICAAVAERASVLVACALSAFLKRVAIPYNNKNNNNNNNNNRKRIKRNAPSVGIDGSLFELHSTFRHRLNTNLRELGHSDVELFLSKDGSGKGAAMVAAASSSSSN